MAQTIEAFVGSALDEAKISPLHRRVIALIAAGYFFDVIDFTVFGSLVPYILQSNFASAAEVAAMGSAAIFGMFIGTAGQGEFSDRFGRRFIYQFNLLLFGVFTILGAFAPSVTLLIACRFIAGIGLGAELRANIRPSASVGASWLSFISLAAPAYGRLARRSCFSSAACLRHLTTPGAASGCLSASAP
jgi:MFS family permease